MGCPPIPIFEISAHPAGSLIVPEMPNIFLYRPCPAYFQVSFLQLFKFFSTIIRNIFIIPQPQIFGAFKRINVAIYQIPMFFLANSINGFSDYSCHMIAVEYNFLCRVRDILFRCCDEGVPHIHGNALNRSPLFRFKLLVIPFKAFLLPLIANVYHAGFIYIVHQRFISVPFGKRLLINTNAFRDSMWLAGQSSIHCPLINSPGQFPVNVKNSASAFNTTFLFQIKNKAFKLIGSSRIIFAKARDYLFYPMLFAANAWNSKMQIGRHLAGIQVSNFTFRRMVIHGIKLTALRAWKFNPGSVFNPNIYSLLLMV